MEKRRVVITGLGTVNPLCRGAAVLILDGDAVDGKSGAIFEPGFHPVGVNIVSRSDGL